MLDIPKLGLSKTNNMPHSNLSLFSQILRLIDRNIFSRIVKEHDSDRHMSRVIFNHIDCLPDKTILLIDCAKRGPFGKIVDMMDIDPAVVELVRRHYVKLGYTVSEAWKHRAPTDNTWMHKEINRGW